MTSEARILSIALPVPLRRLFDYLPPQGIDFQELIPGIRVKVPFQSRTLVGVLIEVKKNSSLPYGKLKAALEVLDVYSIFTDDVYQLCQWAANYYHYPLGEVLSAAMPGLLRKGKAVSSSVIPGEATLSSVIPGEAKPRPGISSSLTANLKLNAAQQPPFLSSRTARRADPGSHAVLLLPVMRVDSRDPGSPAAQASGMTEEGIAAQASGMTKKIKLNQNQEHAIAAVNQAHSRFAPFLLDGVTGSGKTEVYLQTIQKVIEAGEQALVLVPEISLTPQTISRFQARFGQSVAAVHSGLTDKQRFEVWQWAKAGQVSIVIGTRSAIFTPFRSLGLIIVDEEHDSSFKQHDRFRYHARDLAVMRAHYNQVPVILGSATPSLESIVNAKKKRYHYLQLPERAGKAVMPAYHVIDLSSSPHDEGLSRQLVDAMRVQLDAGNQVMLFLNKRGYAPVYYCSECATIIECKRCDARMVYHQNPARLQCHHCNAHKPIPKRCENCQQTALQPLGLGTQRLEAVLEKSFADVPIIRVDRDSTRKKGAMQALLKQIQKNEKAILLGTQMLAKGHHFPNVTLVGIIDADAGLFSADFRAAEQMGQLLLQVAGRAGREDKKGQVLIQTRHPEHDLLQTLLHDGYQAFAEKILQDRYQGELPPYGYVALLRAEAYFEKKAQRFLEKIKDECENDHSQVVMFGPMSALLARRKGLYAQHMIFKASKRSDLQQFLHLALEKIEFYAKEQAVKWVLDVDPIEVI